MKNLLKISDLSAADFKLLLDLSLEFKKKPYSYIEQWKGETVALYFTHRSTRTRLSFQTAICRLGGTAIMLNEEDLQLGRGETITDTAHVFSQYCKGVVIRMASDQDLNLFAQSATVPVINALSNNHHPCQAIADILTLYEHFGTLNQIKLVYIGDGNNVSHSLIEASAIMNIELAIVCPKGYEPSNDILNRAITLAHNNGNTIKLWNTPEEAIQNADAVYTDTWLSMGQPEHEKSEKIKAFASLQINSKLMDMAKPKAAFMHCLPAHRGEEVLPEVIDGPNSIVFKQSENRLCTAQAVLYALSNKLLSGC